MSTLANAWVTKGSGLIDGAVEELGAPVAVESLEPFVEPSLCVARLAG